MDNAARTTFQLTFSGLSAANTAVLLPYRNLISALDPANHLV
jgi:hypothetical protein